MLRRTQKYGLKTGKTPPDPESGMTRLRWGRILILCSIIAVLAIGGVLVPRIEKPTEIETVEKPPLKRRAVNKLGDAEIGYEPRDTLKPLNIEPLAFSYDGDVIDVTLPHNYRGELSVGPSVLVDYDSMQVLWSYRGHELGRIASMSKMMLMFTAYALVDSGAISLFDTVEVSDVAPLMGGSQAYLDRGERYTVSQLLSAIAICSANDAAYLLAEYIGNSHDSTGVLGGVRLMNSFAARLGLKRTKFYNVHGLPPANSWAKTLDEGVAVQRYKNRDMIVATKANVSTPIEMAKLGAAICDYPRLLLYTNVMHGDFWDADSSRVFGPYSMRNHFEPVHRWDIDGIKTGYTSEAGYCVTASAMRSGRRLIAVVFGADKQGIRDQFVIQLFDTAYDSMGIPLDTIPEIEDLTLTEN